MAEEVGFEPTVRFHARRFSRPVQSTTLPHLRRVNDKGARDDSKSGFDGNLVSSIKCDTLGPGALGSCDGQTIRAPELHDARLVHDRGTVLGVLHHPLDAVEEVGLEGGLCAIVSGPAQGLVDWTCEPDRVYRRAKSLNGKPWLKEAQGSVFRQRYVRARAVRMVLESEAAMRSAIVEVGRRAAG